MRGLWTALLVADRLREAAETLARLPLNHPGRQMSSSWPDIVRSFKELKRYTDPGRPRIAPSAAAIDRMDEVILRWLPRLTGEGAGEDVRLLWSWMGKIPAEHLARKLGISRSTLNRRRGAALKKLAVLLNADQVPLVLGPN
jgi:hypothetical protein